MEKCHGIVLKTIPYGDYNQIAIILTDRFGLLKFACPFSRSRKNKAFGHFTPFHELELIFAPMDRELETVKTSTLLHPRLELRGSLDRLEMAGACATAVLKTQLPAKPAPVLFQLLITHLDLLMTNASPQAVALSFLMKLLLHEGTLSVEEGKIFRDAGRLSIGRSTEEALIALAETESSKDLFSTQIDVAETFKLLLA